MDLKDNVDIDKQYFVDEFLKLLAFAENYYKLGMWIAFYNSGLVIAFICVQTQHYSLAAKVYSLFSTMLVAAKEYRLALYMARKLRNASHTAKDCLMKMYAYKQMGYINSELQRYDSAILCFKHMLALAWTCRS